MTMLARSKWVDSTQKNVVSRHLTFLLCVACFCSGMLFTSKMWAVPEDKSISRRATIEDGRQKLVAEDCILKAKEMKREPNDVLKEVSKTHLAIHALDKTVSNLEMELAAAKAAQDTIITVAPGPGNPGTDEPRHLLTSNCY